jgi:hypothetical protein
VPVHTQRLGKAELSPPLPSLIHGIVRTVVHNSPRLSTTLAWLSTVALRGVTRRHRVFGHIEERSLSLGLRVTEPVMRCPFQIIPSVWEPGTEVRLPPYQPHRGIALRLPLPRLDGRCLVRPYQRDDPHAVRP